MRRFMPPVFIGVSASKPRGRSSSRPAFPTSRWGATLSALEAETQTDRSPDIAAAQDGAFAETDAAVPSNQHCRRTARSILCRDDQRRRQHALHFRADSGIWQFVV